MGIVVMGKGWLIPFFPISIFKIISWSEYAFFENYFRDDEIQSERKPDTFFEGYQLQIFTSDQFSKSLAYITLLSYTMDDYEVGVYYGDGERLRRYTISDYKEARNRFISLRDAIIHALRNKYLIMSNRKASNVL